MSPLIALQEKFHTIRKDLRGQSFIEAIVAITIIVTSVTSSLAIVQSSVTSARISGSQVIAAGLVREGLEVVRSVRDTNWLSNRSFEVGLIQGSIKTARPFLNIADGTWSINFSTFGINDEVARMYILNQGAYVHANTQPGNSSKSQFYRILTIDHICRDDSSGVERIVTGVTTCLPGETLVGLAVTSQVSFQGISGITPPLQIAVLPVRLWWQLLASAPGWLLKISLKTSWLSY